MIYATSTEKHFEKLRRLLLKSGYDKSHAALQSLSRLRKSLREKGCSFQPIEGTEASNV
jgi:hypothetical protein